MCDKTTLFYSVARGVCTTSGEKRLSLLSPADRRRSERVSLDTSIRDATPKIKLFLMSIKNKTPLSAEVRQVRPESMQDPTESHGELLVAALF